MIKVYGIPNCDTIKKARKWLGTNGIAFEFHDYKKLGVPVEELTSWVRQAGWETVLNRRGTSWRKLDEKTKANIDEASAITVMVNNPSTIKRPVLVSEKALLIGFKESDYRNLL